MLIIRNYLFYFMEKIFIMNSIKLAIITTLLTISVATAQADTATPNILSSVSENSIQTLNDTESSKIRGEYRICTFFNIYCTFKSRFQIFSDYYDFYHSHKRIGYVIKSGRKLYVAR